jgi:hypothetical protein
MEYNTWFDEITIDALIGSLMIEVDLDLTLEVLFDDDLDGDRGGFCYAPETFGEHGAHAWLTISPEACEQDCEDIRRTLCHELIHLEQYVEGRLSEDHLRQTFSWLNPPWTFYTYPMDYVGVTPWEIEAEDKGGKLYDSFF